MFHYNYLDSKIGDRYFKIFSEEAGYTGVITPEWLLRLGVVEHKKNYRKQLHRYYLISPSSVLPCH